MKKRGAIELSMTTIIVIVIGVTLLSLGLVWVRSTFSNIKGLTDDAFQTAKEEITLTNRDPKLTVPAELKINRGETKAFRMYLINDGSTGDEEFNIDINEEEPLQGLQVKMFGVKEGATKTINVADGEEKELRVVIRVDKTVKVGSYSFNVLVNNGNYDEKGFVVIIEK